MMHGARRLLLLLPLMALQLNIQCLADNAYLQPERIYQGDIAELVIEYDNQIPSLYALDTGELEGDFEILDIKPKISRVSEAGRSFHRMQWKLRILPRRSGRLGIPVLRFGDRSTPPLQLEVSPLTPAMQAADRVFVEIEAIPANPYPGQQIRVVTRLYHNTPIGQGKLSEPAAEAAQIYRQDDENRFKQVRNGVEFDVFERKLLLFAQQRGELKISAAAFSGQIRRPSTEAAGESEAGARKIYRRSNVLQLPVREPPPGYSGKFWLPAKQLEISQRFSAEPADLEVGDSLDWILTVVARGIPAESLPADLLLLDSDRLRIYADQPVLGNRIDSGDLVGRLEQRFAVIATSPGTVELTAPALKWWDVQADRERTVRLQGRFINVVDAAGSAQDSPSPGGIFSGNYWSEWPAGSLEDLRWLLPALLLLGIYTLYRWLKRLFANRALAMIRRLRVRRRLRKACLENHAALTRQALIEWGRGRWPMDSINSLRQIAARIGSDALADSLADLDAALYSPRQADWRGKSLWRLIAGAVLTAAPRREKRESRLASLYPR